MEKELLEKIKRELNALKKWGNDRDIDIDVSLNEESTSKDIYGDRFNSKNVSRSIFLKNDGDVFLFKRPKRNNKKQISYNINYNLLNNGFNIEMDIKKNNIIVNLQDNIVIKELNNFEIIEVINMNMKKVKIASPYDDDHNYSLIYEMILNNDDSLEEAKIEMKTYKANLPKGVKKTFARKKGVKVRLINKNLKKNK